MQKWACIVFYRKIFIYSTSNVWIFLKFFLNIRLMSYCISPAFNILSFNILTIHLDRSKSCLNLNLPFISLFAGYNHNLILYCNVHIYLLIFLKLLNTGWQAVEMVTVSGEILRTSGEQSKLWNMVSVRKGQRFRWSASQTIDHKIQHKETGWQNQSLGYLQYFIIHLWGKQIKGTVCIHHVNTISVMQNSGCWEILNASEFWTRSSFLQQHSNAWEIMMKRAIVWKE